MEIYFLYGANTVKGISNLVSLITHYGNKSSRTKRNYSIALKSMLPYSQFVRHVQVQFGRWSHVDASYELHLI